MGAIQAARSRAWRTTKCAPLSADSLRMARVHRGVDAAGSRKMLQADGLEPWECGWQAWMICSFPEDGGE